MSFKLGDKLPLLLDTENWPLIPRFSFSRFRLSPKFLGDSPSHFQEIFQKTFPVSFKRFSRWLSLWSPGDFPEESSGNLQDNYLDSLSCIRAILQESLHVAFWRIFFNEPPRDFPEDSTVGLQKIFQETSVGLQKIFQETLQLDFRRFSRKLFRWPQMHI